MMGYLVWFNVTEAPDIINSPYNKRVDNQETKVVRGKVFCGGSAVWSDCKRCDASRISGIGKKNGSEEYGQRNSDH